MQSLAVPAGGLNFVQSANGATRPYWTDYKLATESLAISERLGQLVRNDVNRYRNQQENTATPPTTSSSKRSKQPNSSTPT